MTLTENCARIKYSRATTNYARQEKKELLVLERQIMWKLAGGEAKKKRWVVHFVVNVAIDDDVFISILGKKHTMCSKVTKVFISC